MPIILQHIHRSSALNPDDIRDLERLRSDHPAPGPEHRLRLEAGQWLVAGRFNDRILGAAWLEDSPPWWRLHDINVRAMTRRRGVARQLLALLANEAQQARRGLVVADHPTLQVLTPLLLELGFVKTEVPGKGADWVHPLQ